jgi:hypothetical protein
VTGHATHVRRSATIRLGGGIGLLALTLGLVLGAPAQPDTYTLHRVDLPEQAKAQGVATP